MPTNSRYSRFPRSHDAAANGGARGTATTGRAADSRRRMAALDAFRGFHQMLVIRQAIQEGRLPQPKGYFVGDGVARTLDGTPFEPLDWKGIGP